MPPRGARAASEAELGKRFEEGFAVSRDDEVERALGVGGRFQVEFGEKGAGALRHRFARAEHGDARELGGYGRGEELVVRAAEHHDVGAVGDGGGEGGAHGLVGGGSLDVAALDQLGEVVADDAVDCGGFPELLDDAGVEVAVEGAGRGEDGDAPAPGGARRGLHRRDHAHEGHVEKLAQIGDSGGGSGVAGDDDELRIGIEEPVGEGEGTLAHFAGVAGAVGEVRGIGEVDGAFAGGETPEFSENAEAADAGIEHADGSRIHPVKHTSSPALPPPSGVRTAPRRGMLRL